jgi:hypothetical protein
MSATAPDSQVDRILADDAQLVHQLKVGWIDDRNLQASVFEPVRQGADPQQNVQRDRFGGVRLDPLDAEVDLWQAVALGQSGLGGRGGRHGPVIGALPSDLRR